MTPAARRAAPTTASRTSAAKTSSAKKSAAKKATSKKATSKKTAAKKAGAKVRAKGMSLHIGLNFVDPGHYDGWDGELTACENDAHSMAAICTANGIKPSVLLTKQGTRAAVLKGIRRAAKSLTTGDIFVLTYSGHGGQVDDTTGEEDDGIDETWCLWDGELIDDELYLELGKFAKGVRVLVLSDSCHSGTVTRAARTVTNLKGSRAMPADVATRVYEKNKAFYDGLQRAVAAQTKRRAGTEVDIIPTAMGLSPQTRTIVRGYKPAVILISGCMDNQTSRDGDVNGAFTESLLNVWQNGAFVGDYPKFHAAIKAGLPRDQTPNLFVLGPAAKFLAQKPFTR